MILMATGDVLVYFMPKNGQELNNIANPHWAAPGLHDRVHISIFMLNVDTIWQVLFDILT